MLTWHCRGHIVVKSKSDVAIVHCHGSRLMSVGDSCLDDRHWLRDCGIYDPHDQCRGIAGLMILANLGSWIGDPHEPCWDLGSMILATPLVIAGSINLVIHDR